MLVAMFVALFVTMIVVSVLAQAQEHSHPVADAPIHEKFYSTWHMPDEPIKSCCDKKDCYPTRAELRDDGHWWAERREDHLMMQIPHRKLEVNRSSPDGRSHLCAHAPTTPAAAITPVLCFVPGGGT